MTNTAVNSKRQRSQISAPMVAVLRFSILSVIVSSADAFHSPSLIRSHGRTASVQPLRVSDLQQESTQFNETVAENSADALPEPPNVVQPDAADDSHITLDGQADVVALSDEEMVEAMSEQMSDFLTTLDDAETSNVVQQVDEEVMDFQPEPELIANEAQVEKTSVSDIVDEMLDDRPDDLEEEDPVLKELEETLLATIQVLEDTLQETQIVNELETRELKADQARLEQELQEQKELNEKTMNQLQVERDLVDQLASAKSPETQVKGLDGLLDPSSIPEGGVVISPDDIAKFLQIQQERHSQELDALQNKLQKEEEKRVEMEKQNVKLEAAASAAKAIAEGTKQEDTVLQQKLQEQQEMLELANRKVKKLDAELTTSKKQLEDQSTEAKTAQVAVKASEKEFQEKLEKLEADMKKLTMNDTKAQATISNLEATTAELEETLKKVKHEKATSKAAATSAQKDLKQAKQSLAESMAKIGRLETKLARSEMQQSPSKKSSTPKKETAQAKQQPPKSSPAASTAQKTPRLDNWELTDDGEVQGLVYDHPSLPDGEPIRTSVLVNSKIARDGAMVKTSSGSRYKLGKKKGEAAPPPAAPKQPVADAKKPEPKANEPAPSPPPAPVAKQPAPVNLFSSFQAKAKNPVKKTEEPKPVVEAEAKAKQAPLKPSPSVNLFAGFQPKPKNPVTKEEPKPVVVEEEVEETKAKNVSPAIGNIFGVKKTKEPEAKTETEEPKPADVTAKKPPATSLPLPRINFFGNNVVEKTEDEIEEEEKPEDESAKPKQYSAFNIFGSKPAAKDKVTSDDEPETPKPEPTKAASTSSYGRKKIQTNEKAMEDSMEELTLTGKSICNGKYLLAGKPKKSVTGRCLILGAYHADANAKPTGNPIVIKLSENTDAMKKEYSIYKRVASAVNKGVVVKCHSFVPEVADRPGKSALILERGARDLKEHRRWVGMKGEDLKEGLFSVAQCLDSIHGARMVWTDLKTENFVVVETEDGKHKVKAIDLESAMNLKDHPKDFTPEASPPEFAREYVSGDPHSFVLNYSFDVWSFGMLAYELAAGVGYYDGNGPDAIMQKLSQKNVPNPTIGIEDDDLVDLISQCLSLDPKQRPSSQKIVRHPYFASVAKPTLFNLW